MTQQRLLDRYLGCYYIHPMMTKHMVSLTDPQAAYLKAEAQKLGISVADLIRRIIDQHRSASSRD